MGNEITENWPEFCFDGNRICFKKMISGLKRYGYIREFNGAYDIHSSLREDHPDLFEFLISYVIQRTALRVTEALDKKKVKVVFDSEGKKKYAFEEDAFEMD